MQSAYRSLHSTETALLKVQNNVLSAINEGSAVVLLMLNISTALDPIDVFTIYTVLEVMFNFTLGSYLSDRTQSVNINASV